MIRVAKLREGTKYSNRNQVAYEACFAKKFELVESLPNYDKLEAFAQKCIDLHCGDSLDGISARNYMDKVIEMSDDEFVAWAKAF